MRLKLLTTEQALRREVRLTRQMGVFSVQNRRRLCWYAHVHCICVRICEDLRVVLSQSLQVEKLDVFGLSCRRWGKCPVWPKLHDKCFKVCKEKKPQLFLRIEWCAALCVHPAHAHLSRRCNSANSERRRVNAPSLITNPPSALMDLRFYSGFTPSYHCSGRYIC